MPNPLYYDDHNLKPAIDAPMYDTFPHEDAMIFRRGVPVDVQNEDRFSPMNTFAYSPLAQEYMSLDNAVLALIVLKLAKSNPNLLVKLMDKYMNNVTKLLTSIVESGKAHPLTGLNASTLFAVVAHRFGIITDSGYLKMVDQTRKIVDQLILLDWATQAQGIMAGLETLVEKSTVTGAGAATGLPAILSLAKAVT